MATTTLEDDKFNHFFFNEGSVSERDLITNILEQRWHIVNLILASNHFIDEIKINGTYCDPNPLHLACSMESVPYRVVENILKIYGNSCCLLEDEDGSLPIHIACSNLNIDQQIILLLLKASPDTCKEIT